MRTIRLYTRGTVLGYTRLQTYRNVLALVVAGNSLMQKATRGVKQGLQGIRRTSEDSFAGKKRAIDKHVVNMRIIKSSEYELGSDSNELLVPGRKDGQILEPLKNMDSCKEDVANVDKLVLLLQMKKVVALRVRGHHNQAEFVVQDREPKDEVQIYTWMDATLCDLTDMVFKFEHFLTRNVNSYTRKANRG
ncbi:histone deacetylase complex subunit SAP18 [Tanacetum coccineum]